MIQEYKQAVNHSVKLIYCLNTLYHNYLHNIPVDLPYWTQDSIRATWTRADKDKTG